MALIPSILSHNIKVLRKRQKISQEELAALLNIKRSNIAAYESKNVEPRLRIILEMAKQFNVSLTFFIGRKIVGEEKIPAFAKKDTAEQNHFNNSFVLENIDVKDFIKKSIRIRRILEGFKAFYTFKKNAFKSKSPEKEKLIFDIDNFIELMEHLLSYNESVIKALSPSSSNSNNI